MSAAFRFQLLHRARSRRHLAGLRAIALTGCSDCAQLAVAAITGGSDSQVSPPPHHPQSPRPTLAAQETQHA